MAYKVNDVVKMLCITVWIHLKGCSVTVIQHIESKLGYRVLAQCTRGSGLKSLIENQVLVTLPQNHIAPCMSTPNSLMPQWFLMGIPNIGMLIIFI